MSLTTKSVSLQAMHVERFLSGSVWKRQAVFLPFQVSICSALHRSEEMSLCFRWLLRDRSVSSTSQQASMLSKTVSA